MESARSALGSLPLAACRSGVSAGQSLGWPLNAVAHVWKAIRNWQDHKATGPCAMPSLQRFSSLIECLAKTPARVVSPAPDMTFHLPAQ